VRQLETGLILQGRALLRRGSPVVLATGPRCLMKPRHRSWTLPFYSRFQDRSVPGPSSYLAFADRPLQSLPDYDLRRWLGRDREVGCNQRQESSRK